MIRQLFKKENKHKSDFLWALASLILRNGISFVYDKMLWTQQANNTEKQFECLQMMQRLCKALIS